MSWLLAVALVAAGTVSTLLALTLTAIIALVLQKTVASGYRTLVRWRKSPRLASQS